MPHNARRCRGIVRFHGNGIVSFALNCTAHDKATALRARIKAELDVEPSVVDSDVRLQWPSDQDAFKKFASAAGIIVDVLGLQEDNAYWHMFYWPEAAPSLRERDTETREDMTAFFAL